MPISTPVSPWLSSKEAANRLGIHPATLDNWRRKGRGPKFERLGDGPKPRVRYNVKDVDAWMRSTNKAGAA